VIQRGLISGKPLHVDLIPEDWGVSPSGQARDIDEVTKSHDLYVDQKVILNSRRRLSV
jgi:hypothetical protein